MAAAAAAAVNGERRLFSLLAFQSFGFSVFGFQPFDF